MLLAHKSLPVDLRDARTDAKSLAEGKALTPLGTLPVLREPDGRILTDSFAIALYLEHAYAGPSYFPANKDDAFLVGSVLTLVDRAMNLLVDLGTRYHDLRNDAAWPAIQTEQTKRAQGALDEIAKLIQDLAQPTIAASGFGIADIWLLTAVLWVEAWPARAPSTPLVQQLLALGVTMPATLSRWADAHRARAAAIFDS